MDEELKKSIDNNDSNGNKRDSLLFKFGLIFAVFTLLTLILSGFAAYFFQERIYKEEVEKNVQNLAEYLQSLIKADDMDFVHYQDFMIKYSDDINIPLDYDGGYFDSMDKYNNMFAEYYPGMVIDEDVYYDDMPYEIRKAHAVYTHEYWLYVFETATKVFDVAYTYYITPTGEPEHMYYVIDGMREEKLVGGKSYIDLLQDINEPVEKYPLMWKTWDEGLALHTPDVSDNEFGHTYAFYYPLSLNNEKIGLICVDVEIDLVNKKILKNTMILILILGLVLIFGIICVLIFIDRNYIHKLEVLDINVKSYADSKDPKIADLIKKDVTSTDEISSLARQTANMILELDSYMKNLVSTTKELSETKKKAKNLQNAANKDSLTGIRNRNAYEEEVRKITTDLMDGNCRFGIAVIDLNYLKKINDIYGHDKGNVSIKKLCMLVCNVFNHSPVFRTGGDEFAVILKNRDYDHANDLIYRFNSEIEMTSHDDNLEPWDRISASIGAAFYDSQIDKTVDDVIKRADANMYKRKQEMKATRD